jgi:tRNA(fMet)-specific endonuclease VapC
VATNQGILLDSSAVIAHLRGKIDLFTLVPPEEPLFLPLVALGKLYKGALKSLRPEHNLARIETFLQLAAVLHPDSATARRYAEAARDLESKGQVIPENDIWIAALALECDLPLATRDAHFERIAGLRVLRW